MSFSMGQAERTREDITSKRHRREEELSHTRLVEERLIASNEQGQAESRQRVEHAKERKEEAKLRGKEIGRQRALLHREERQRQEKERERQGERERARQEQRARRRAGGIWNRTRESQKVAGRRSYESMPTTADDEEHGGENNKTRRRNASGERSEARAGRRDARDKRRRSASIDSEVVYGHGRGRSDGGGDADLDGMLTVRGESTMPRSRSGRRDRETRVSDKMKERSRKSERKERRRREFRDHKGKTDVSFRASEVAWRGPQSNRSSVGDGGRWQPSPSPGAIDSMPSARSSHAPDIWRSSTQLPLSVGKPNRRADSRRPRGTAPDPRMFLPSRPLLRQHGGTGTLLLPLVTRGMGSGTLDLGTRSGAGRRTGGGMGTLSVL